MTAADETALLAALRRRDSAAFARVFDDHADKIFRLAAGLLKDEFQAEGVVQDTFETFLTRLDQFEGRSRIGTWLYRVAYNKALDRLRSQKREPYSVDTMLDQGTPLPTVFVDWHTWPEARLSAAERSRALAAAIDQLPGTYRATFILREIEQLSTAETAAILEISASAVKVRLHRARLFLREALSEAFATQEVS